MKSAASMKSMINEISYKKSSMINDRTTNDISVNERDYMIRTAMDKLETPMEWKNAVAKAANYLPRARFWELVEIAKANGKNKTKYFLGCARREYARR